MLTGKRTKFPNAGTLTVLDPTVEFCVEGLLSSIVAGGVLAMDIVASNGVPPVGLSDCATEVDAVNIEITDAPS